MIVIVAIIIVCVLDQALHYGLSVLSFDVFEDSEYYLHLKMRMLL